MPTSICTDTLSHPHYPSPCTMSLPPLSKGGGLTARHKLLLCCVLLAICPPFLCYKLFCRQDGGIVTPSPLPKPHYPSPRTKLVSLVKGEVLSPEKIRATTGGIVLHPPTSPSPQPLQKDNNPSPHVCPFIQYVNHSQVCSPAHSSAFGTASPQDRYKAPK